MVAVIAIILHLVTAGWLVWFFVHSDRGSREPVRGLIIAALFGLVSLVLATIAYALIEVPSPENVSYFTSFGVAWGAGWKIGLIEETAKLLPILLFIYKRPYFNEHTDGVIYFGLAGLVFGTVENILYVGFSGAGLIRIFFTPFFHATTTAIIGYGIARFRLKSSSLGLPIVLYVLMVMAHALYDASAFYSAQQPLYIFMMLGLSIASTIGVFVIYHFAHRFDTASSLSTDGVRKFCRRCGAENPQDTVYCARCGKLA